MRTECCTRKPGPTVVILCLTVAALSGCATLKVHNDAQRLEESGQIEAAYRVLQAGIAEHPEHVGLAAEARRIREKLAFSYRAQAAELQKLDLRGRLVLLEKAAGIEEAENAELQERRKFLASELARILARVESVDSEGALEKFRLFWKLRAYRPHLIEVQQLETDLNSNLDSLHSEISGLAESHTEASMILSRAAQTHWPEEDDFADLLNELLEPGCAQLLEISDLYHDTRGREQVATEAFFLFAAATYCGDRDDLMELAVSATAAVREEYFPSVTIEGSLLATHRSEFSDMFATNGWLLFGLVDSDAADVVVRIDVRDIAIERNETRVPRFSRYLSGHQQQANPVYQQQLVELQNAQVGLVNANAIYAPSGVAAILKLAAVIGARTRVNEWSALVRQTPPYLSIPIFADYQYEAIKNSYEPTVQLDVAIWDRRTKRRVSSSVIRETERVEETTFLGVHPQDANDLTANEGGDISAQSVLTRFRWKTFNAVAESASRQITKINIDRALDSFEEHYVEAARDYLFAQSILDVTGGVEDIKARSTDVFSGSTLIDFIDELLEEEGIAPGRDNYGLASDLHAKRLAQSSAFEVTATPLGREAFSQWSPLEFIYRPFSSLVAVRRAIPMNASAERLPSVSAAPNQPTELLSIESIVKRSTPAVVVVKSAEATGSGFVIGDKGLIVTNAHVVGSSDEVSVIFSNDSRTVGQVIERSVSRDLALVQVPLEGLSTLRLGDPNSIQPGASVVAIGAPYGFTQTVTSGVVSAVRRLPSAANRDLIVRYVQTDAAINVGNSGGPLLNRRGEVIAVNTYLVGRSGGLGLSVSVAEIRTAFPDHFSRDRRDVEASQHE